MARKLPDWDDMPTKREIRQMNGVWAMEDARLGRAKRKKVTQDGGASRLLAREKAKAREPAEAKKPEKAPEAKGERVAQRRGNSPGLEIGAGTKT